MESTLKNMILTLLLITLAAAGALGMVYQVTKEPIAAAKTAKTTQALALVLPSFDNNPSQDTVRLTVDGLPTTVYTAKSGGKVVGYAVEGISRQGYSGDIKLIVGFQPDGNIINIEVLEHNETPGLGSKMADPDNRLLLSFKGNNVDNLQMSVREKDGGDIDGLTASTISSRAYIDAVQRAYNAFKVVALGEDLPSTDYPALLAEVLPPYDNSPGEQERSVSVDDATLKYFTGTLEGEITGIAIETFTTRGYNGEIYLLAGFDTRGTITGIEVVSQNETQGFGADMTHPDNKLKLSFVGKNAGELKMSLRFDGGDIDALAASTISSEAYIDAMQRAWQAFNLIMQQ